MDRWNRLDWVSDRALADRYWEAQAEMRRLRRARHERSGEEMASDFQRIRDLDVVCERLWSEHRRRTQAGSLAGLA